MSFILSILRDNPDAAFQISDVFNDKGKFNYSGSMLTGSMAKTLGCVSGSANSGVLNRNAYGKVSGSPYVKGNERKEFSIEAIFTPTDILASTTTFQSPQRIASAPSQFDGLSIDGTVVSFTIRFQDVDPVTVSYDIGFYQRVHAVGVKAANGIILFINGVSVATATFTDEQYAALFENTNNTGEAHTGYTVGSQQIAIGFLGFYSYAMRTERVLKHYNSSITDQTMQIVRAAFKFEDLNIDSLNDDRYINIYHDSVVGWADPQLTGIGVSKTQLLRADASGTPEDGSIVYTVDLSNPTVSNAYGLIVDVEGLGFKIQVSEDFLNWTDVPTGLFSTLFALGSWPIDTNVFVRIVLLASADDAYIDSIRIRGYLNASSYAQGNPDDGGRQITLSNMGIGWDQTPPENLSSATGFYGDGTVVISADSSGGAEVVGTQEYLVKRLDSNAVTWPSGTSYINGAASVLTNLKVGIWELVHLTGSPANASKTIDGNVHIASLSFNERQLSSNEISAVYLAYMSADPIVVSTSSSIAIANPGSPVTIVAEAWTM